MTGRDLMDLGIAPGAQMGAALEALLEAVLDGKTPNEREALRERAKKLAGIAEK